VIDAGAGGDGTSHLLVLRQFHVEFNHSTRRCVIFDQFNADGDSYRGARLKGSFQCPI
jgi:hypothetical protein